MNKFKHLRESLHITQSKMAEIFKTSQSTMCRLEMSKKLSDKDEQTFRSGVVEIGLFRKNELVITKRVLYCLVDCGISMNLIEILFNPNSSTLDELQKYYNVVKHHG